MVMFFIVFFCSSHLLCKAQIASAKVIHWSKEKLNFSDFYQLPDSVGDKRFLAYTHCRLEYKYRLDSDINGSAKTLTVEVVNWFSKSRSSWMRESAVGDSNVLIHEQGHFDLGEIFARKFARQVCLKRFSKNYRSELKTLFDQLLSELREDQMLYEKQTRGGSNTQEQFVWTEVIKEKLKVPAEKIVRKEINF